MSHQYHALLNCSRWPAPRMRFARITLRRAILGLPNSRPLLSRLSGFATSSSRMYSTSRISALSAEQKHILDLALAGQSFFFTGSAGTGKSYLLREIIHQLRTRRKNVQVTASTGLAAQNIGGKTLHSFAGVGLGNQHASALLKMALNAKTMKRWLATDVLIIDEISMVDARWFDVLSMIGQKIRLDDRAFGGLQLILCGDFFQLPPVPDQGYIDKNVPVSFAFEAKDWKRAAPNMFRLTKVFRQRQPEFIRLLDEMRIGQLSEASIKIIYGCARNLPSKHGVKPVELFPLRMRADAANKTEMKILPGPTMRFNAVDSLGKDTHGKPISPERGRVLLDRMVTETIDLKIGSQVMCIQNLSDTIVNGSVGKVTGFKTIPEAVLSPEIIEYLPSSDPNWRPGDPPPPLKIPLEKLSKRQKFPMVQYENGEHMLVVPFRFRHINVEGKEEASRTQIPLILAWALTVHKAQGKTIERVKVDLAGTFAPGQTYVGISRCTSLEGLEVQNFSPSIVFAHPKVMKWSERLSSIVSGGGQ